MVLEPEREEHVNNEMHNVSNLPACLKTKQFIHSGNIIVWLLWLDHGPEGSGGECIIEIGDWVFAEQQQLV